MLGVTAGAEALMEVEDLTLIKQLTQSKKQTKVINWYQPCLLMLGHTKVSIANKFGNSIKNVYIEDYAT